MLNSKYKKISKAFGAVSEDYDGWYEGNILFENELKAIKLLGKISSPSLEIGVGTGRFAQALNISFGLDPSKEMLKLAKKRGIKTVCGIAEKLPIKDQSLATVSFFFTLCFLSDVEKAIKEAYRVLKLGGYIILGFVPRESPWGNYYFKKGQKGHPLYKFANFLSTKEVSTLLKKTGFQLIKASSVLFFDPESPPKHETPKLGIHPEAGFVVMIWSK